MRKQLTSDRVATALVILFLLFVHYTLENGSYLRVKSVHAQFIELVDDVEEPLSKHEHATLTREGLMIWKGTEYTAYLRSDRMPPKATSAALKVPQMSSAGREQ